MLGFAATGSIFAYSAPVDFRKQHDGLYAIVRQELGRNPLDGALYLFFNRRRDRVKILVWDRNGFWLFYKRLEQGTFQPGLFMRIHARRPKRLASPAFRQLQALYDNPASSPRHSLGCGAESSKSTCNHRLGTADANPYE